MFGSVIIMIYTLPLRRVTYRQLASRSIAASLEES